MIFNMFSPKQATPPTQTQPLNDVLQTWTERIVSLESRVLSLELENKNLRDKVLRKVQIQEQRMSRSVRG